MNDSFYCLCRNGISFLYCISISKFAVFWLPCYGPFPAKIWQDFVPFRVVIGTIYQTLFICKFPIQFVCISYFALYIMTSIIGVVFRWGGFSSLFPAETRTVGISPLVFLEDFLLTLFISALLYPCVKKCWLTSCRGSENQIPKCRLFTPAIRNTVQEYLI